LSQGSGDQWICPGTSSATSPCSTRARCWKSSARRFEELHVAEEEIRVQSDELQRVHGALAEEATRYRELFEHAPVAYLVTDRFGAITDANYAAQQLFRYRGDRLRGKPIAVFTHGASRRRLRAAIHTVGTHRESATLSLTVRDTARRVRRIEATVAAVRDARGDATGLRWLLVDQTRKLRRARSAKARARELELLIEQRTADLVQAQQLKDNLIATVSHEFRTALSAIGGYAELLELGVRGPLSDAQLADVRRINHAHAHLARVVEDLLNYTRLVSGPRAVEVNDVPLADALGGLVDLIAPSVAAKEIRLEVEPLDPRLSVRGDTERIKQIVLNLLGNAVKFTEANGTIRLSCCPNESTVEIAVNDSGVGIPEDRLDSVFEPFVRLRNASGKPGTGLGLSISRDLARAMGGDVIATSAAGHGSRFALVLQRSTSLASQAPIG
jgi:PAS domain S-box-containing protein